MACHSWDCAVAVYAVAQGMRPASLSLTLFDLFDARSLHLHLGQLKKTATLGCHSAMFAATS
eukprot:6203383-Pleurochrysis_carterae.AAC.8